MEGETEGPGGVLEEPEGETGGSGGSCRGWRGELRVLSGPLGIGGGDWGS